MSDDKITIKERIENISQYLGITEKPPVVEYSNDYYDDRGWDDVWTDQPMSTIKEAQERANKK